MCSTKDLNIILGPFSDPERSASVQKDAEKRGIDVSECYREYIEVAVDTLSSPRGNSDSGFDALFAVFLKTPLHVQKPFVGIARLRDSSYPTMYFSSDSVFDMQGESLKQEFSEVLSDGSTPKALANFIGKLLHLEWIRYLVVEKPESTSH